MQCAVLYSELPASRLVYAIAFYFEMHAANCLPFSFNVNKKGCKYHILHKKRDEKGLTH